MKHQKDTPTPELPNFECVPSTNPYEQYKTPDREPKSLPIGQRELFLRKAAPTTVSRNKKHGPRTWAEDC